MVLTCRETDNAIPDDTTVGISHPEILARTEADNEDKYNAGMEEYEEATTENNWSSYDGYNQNEDATHVYDNTATQGTWRSYRHQLLVVI